MFESGLALDYTGYYFLVLNLLYYETKLIIMPHKKKRISTVFFLNIYSNKNVNN